MFRQRRRRPCFVPVARVLATATSYGVRNGLSPKDAGGLGLAAWQFLTISTVGATNLDGTDPATTSVHSSGDPAVYWRHADLVVAGVVTVPLTDTFGLRRIDDAFRASRGGPAR